GLAAARRPQKGEELPPFDPGGYAVQRREGAETLGRVLDRQIAHSPTLPPRLRPGYTSSRIFVLQQRILRVSMSSTINVVENEREEFNAYSKAHIPGFGCGARAEHGHQPRLRAGWGSHDLYRPQIIDRRHAAADLRA